MNPIKVKLTVTLPEMEMEHYEAWNFGCNLLKSSIESVRKIGHSLCTQILDQDARQGIEVSAKRVKINRFFRLRNPS